MFETLLLKGDSEANFRLKSLIEAFSHILIVLYDCISEVLITISYV